jgi:PIN domain nuclease of toxin-antitoxin system
MTKYLLDTHVLIWFLEKNKRLSDNIREDIEYMQYEYSVSFLSLMEIDNLRKLGKIELQLTTTEIIKQLNESCIDVYYGNIKDLKILDGLEMKTINRKIHGDYIDRMIIAMSIAHNHTCISADEKFPYYIKDGLTLLEI